MAQIFESYFEFIVAVLLIGIMISVSGSGFCHHNSSSYCTSPSDGNMTAPMLESTRFHLKAADELITKGDTISALVK